MSDTLTKAEWAQKDKDRQASIVAQSCLERAIETVMGLGGSGLDPFTLENVKKRVTETYNYYCELVWKKSKTLANEDITKALNSLPVPTPNQKKLLSAAQAKYEFTDEQIFQATGKYPNNNKEMKTALTKLGVKYD